MQGTASGDSSKPRDHAEQPAEEQASNESDTSLELSEYLSQISLQDLLEADFIDKSEQKMVRKSSINNKQSNS